MVDFPKKIITILSPLAPQRDIPSEPRATSTVSQGRWPPRWPAKARSRCYGFLEGWISWENEETKFLYDWKIRWHLVSMVHFWTLVEHMKSILSGECHVCSIQGSLVEIIRSISSKFRLINVRFSIHFQQNFVILYCLYQATSLPRSSSVFFWNKPGNTWWRLCCFFPAG